MYSVTVIKVSQAGFKNFCYLITDHATKRAALVDPAWQLATVENALKSAEARLDCILLTHSHFDHVNLVDALVKSHRPRLFLSRLESEGHQYLPPGGVLLEDGDRFELGETAISALLTPGHTAGGICYSLENDLFTGDTLFSEGCGICDQPGGSASEMFESLNKIRRLIPGHARIWPGHSFGKQPGSTLSDVIEGNIYFHFRTAEEFTRFRMRNSSADPLGFR
jgi:hydroxyacylglutathione hydrolase